MDLKIYNQIPKFMQQDWLTKFLEMYIIHIHSKLKYSYNSENWPSELNSAH